MAITIIRDIIMVYEHPGTMDGYRYMEGNMAELISLQLNGVKLPNLIQLNKINYYNCDLCEYVPGACFLTDPCGGEFQQAHTCVSYH